ncbi:MAG: alpha/beta fold hydrolase, partial [Chloroflexi bacterium]|nr:alpha/beta fold hydrolase [Chloroflexota bacterium]
MIRRGFADVEDLQIHYAECGQGQAVLLLHQTPRSWEEFRDVLPLLGKHFRAIAMDTAGFGDSSKPQWSGTIAAYARIVAGLLGALGIDRAHVVGHHTGGVIAVELAAGYPGLVDKLVLSSAPLIDAEYHRMRAERPAPDNVKHDAHGQHLLDLWRGREGFYPEDRPDLLDRFVMDALKAGEGAHKGHEAVSRYDMSPRLPLIKAP